MDPSLLCKAFFGLGAAVSIGGTLLPSFRTHIMNYGSRSTTTTEPKQVLTEGSIDRILEFICSIRVPHSWFAHYYVVSVLSSCFWGYQIYTQGSVFRFLASYSHQASTTMTANQVVLAWILMLVQGIRRLYESFTLTKPSQSKMWVGLWLIGMGYYIFIGVAVWIEGINVLRRNVTLRDQLDISSPSFRTCVSVALFVVASGVQNRCHVYLTNLKKYTLPQHRLFKQVLCPHYTSECMVYLAIAILAAPPGYVLSKTVAAGLGFVFANLAVTADSTREWYVERFGAEKVAGRRRMIPYLY